MILLATGPGPKSIHNATHFAQDIDFFRMFTEMLARDYGVAAVGGWHSHHGLGLNEQSPGDIKTVREFCSRNKLNSWCEIIATHADLKEVLK